MENLYSDIQINVVDIEMVYENIIINIKISKNNIDVFLVLIVNKDHEQEDEVIVWVVIYFVKVEVIEA